MTEDKRSGLWARLTYANVMSTLAVVLVMAGGSAYAATKLITGDQIAKGTITAKNIRTRSLLAKDFAQHQLPQGPKGAQGPQGARGVQGLQGAAGSALAYATVVVSSGSTYSTPLSQYSGSHAGFTSLTEPDDGLYCLGPVFLDADGATIEPVVSAFGPSPESRDLIVLGPSGSDLCGSAAYQVDTFGNSQASGPSSTSPGSGFSIAVP